MKLKIILLAIVVAILTSCARNPTVMGVPKNVWVQLTPDQQQQFAAQYQQQVKQVPLQPAQNPPSSVGQ